MRPPRIPIPKAIQIFPNLHTWVSPRPRQLNYVPLGNQGPLESIDIAGCIRHLYHDLGVLAFSGMNAEQIRRVGDIIQNVVKAGGIGTLITAVKWATPTSKTRIDPLEEGDFYESCDVRHAGLIQPTSLIRIAETSLRNHITTHHFHPEGLDPSIYQLRARNVVVRGAPAPSRALHYTTSPILRSLPLDAYTTTSIDPNYSTLRGQLQLYTAAGQGSYVGSCDIEYSIFRIDEEVPDMKRQNIDNNNMYLVEKHIEKSQFSQRELYRKKICENILREVFQLEREVLGEKIQEWLAKHNKTTKRGSLEEGGRERHDPLEQGSQSKSGRHRRGQAIGFEKLSELRR